MGETYYDVLEVDSDATQNDIQSAYRDRVLETHPDHNDAPDATEQFQRVARAKSVLTDRTERARYDRLGHEAYVRRFQSDEVADPSSEEPATASHAATDRSDSTATASSHADTTAASSQTGTTAAETDRAGETDTRTDRRTASTAGQSGPTATRHASEPQQQADTHRKSDSRSFDFADTAARATTRETSGSPEIDQADEDDAEFRYSVHDWDGEIDLEREGQPLSHTTAVTIGCLWVLYPILVASSLTSLFPTVVNAIVGACTLGVVGYVLLRPRIATVVFGIWSLVFPIVLLQFDIVAPTSVVGILVLGYVWIPFGYAVGLWWALKP